MIKNIDGILLEIEKVTNN